MISNYLVKILSKDKIIFIKGFKKSIFYKNIKKWDKLNHKQLAKSLKNYKPNELDLKKVCEISELINIPVLHYDLEVRGDFRYVADHYFNQMTGYKCTDLDNVNPDLYIKKHSKKVKVKVGDLFENIGGINQAVDYVIMVLKDDNINKYGPLIDKIIENYEDDINCSYKELAAIGCDILFYMDVLDLLEQIKK